MLSEKALTNIQKHILCEGRKCLLIVGESAYKELAVLHKYVPFSHCITNRFEVAENARTLGATTFFNDFDFSSLANTASFDCVIIPVSKEKLVTHHAINQVFSLLSNSGQLLLIGKKNQGIKSYFDNCKKTLGYSGTLKKEKDEYVCILSPPTEQPVNLLKDDNYSSLRPAVEIDNYIFQSKPGVFGWNKIDKGSEILVEQLAPFLDRLQEKPNSALDLGCGYGYLSYALHKHGIANITATDNNAAAIKACNANVMLFKGAGDQVLASHCAQSLHGLFDLIICNPPFHTGFSVASDLTNLFLEQSQYHLNKNGNALFVVNSFIPLEKKSYEYFHNVNLLINTGQFKVIALSSPK